MKKSVLCVSLFAAFTFSTWAQEANNAAGYVFNDVKINASGPIRNQQSSGTCWAFSGLTFLEGEILKAGKGEVDLSDMWIARNNYYEKSVDYVRYHGNLNFGEGSITPNVFMVIDKYGIVPESAYEGKEYGSDVHRHAELSKVLKAYLDAVITNPNRTLSTGWLKGVDGILDAYFGPKPEKFTYNGKEYTPKSFAESLGLDMDNYVTVTSFSHQPFYKPFVLEVPDNWRHFSAYNVPLEDMMEIIDASLDKGHNVVWASDVSERGFQYNKGFAVVPATKTEDISDSEKAKWTALTPEEINKMASKLDSPGPEIKITQELRQQEFDDYRTTDDHGMVLMGTAADQNGTPYYKVQNSWGESGAYKGYFYVSKPFVAFKTTAIAVNKKTIPASIARKLGIK